MRKLADIKDVEAVKFIGDILELATEFMTDENAVKAIQAQDKLKIAKCLTSDHPDLAIRLMQLMSEDGVEYHCNVVTIIKDLLDVLNDEDLMAVFSSQSQTVIWFGSAMGNTGEARI